MHIAYGVINTESITETISSFKGNNSKNKFITRQTLAVSGV